MSRIKNFVPVSHQKMGEAKPNNILQSQFNKTLQKEDLLKTLKIIKASDQDIPVLQLKSIEDIERNRSLSKSTRKTEPKTEPKNDSKAPQKDTNLLRPAKSTPISNFRGEIKRPRM